MRVSAVKKSLQMLKKTFRKIWKDGAEDVIVAAVYELEASKSKFDKRSSQSHDKRLVPEPWGYRISPKQPLCFGPSTAIKGLSCRLDLYCTVLWKQEEELPVKQEITVRLWSDELNYIYREDWDSPDVYSKLTDERVMARWHFDLANPGQSGPKYHLQFGGNARSDELHWFPEIIKIPRFAYPPMDLILVCQMIAANFYRDDYASVREDSIWKSCVFESQQHLLLDYYKRCVTEIERKKPSFEHEKKPLLDVLWNTE